jgi:hypothetical protein
MAATGDDQSMPSAFDPEALPPLLCIAGAPRCGTTALAEFLRSHPEVCFSRIKEPHFFSRFGLARLNDDELRSTVIHSYLERYFRWTGNERVFAEGSVSYFYAADRMRSLLRIWPSAKFIILLRDPMQLLPSYHQRLLYLGDETERDFGKAWRLTNARARGREIPRSCVDPRLLRYDKIAALGKHLGEFFDVVGRHRCLILLHEDFAEDPAVVYREALRFIGVRSFAPPKQRVHRASAGYRIGWLQRLLYRPPLVTRAVLRRASKPDAVLGVRDGKSPAIARFGRKLRRQLVHWNRTPAPPIVIPSDVRREICDLLADDVAQLSTLIGRDLSHWLDGAAQQAIGEPRFQRRAGNWR